MHEALYITRLLILTGVGIVSNVWHKPFLIVKLKVGLHALQEIRFIVSAETSVWRSSISSERLPKIGMSNGIR